MRFSPALIFFVAFVSECFSQSSPVKILPVEATSVNSSLKIDSLMMMYFESGYSTGFTNVPFDAYSPPPQKRGGQWWHPSYFRFSLRNDSGKEFTTFIYLAKDGGEKLARVSSNGAVMQMIEPVAYAGPGLFDEQYFPVSIPADSTWHLVIRSETQILYQHLNAWLIEPSFFKTFIHAYTWKFFDMTFFHCVVGGMLAMMLLYVLAQFLFFRTPEYGYYAAYIFTMVLFLFVNSWEIFEFDFLSKVNGWYYPYNDYLQMLAYCMYFAFLSSYSNARNLDRVLYRSLQIAIVVLLLYLTADFVCRWIWMWLPNIWWLMMRCMLIVFVLFLAWRVWRIKLPYARYPIYGGVAFMLFGSIALVVDRNEPAVRELVSWPFNYEMFYYFCGVIVELVFFSVGLAHKRRQDAIEKVEAQEALKLEVERQQVRHLNALSEVQEKERSRFAKDLHDGLGGMLSGVKLSLSNMKGNVVLNSEYVDVFERALDMLDNSIHELRRVAHNLMPEALVKFGLAASLKDFCDFINSSKVIHAIFQQIGPYKRLDMSVEIVLYRIANELVNNAMRHAAATELIIQLNYDDHSLTLTVEDNGKGFDQGILDRTTGAGWPNIKSRVAYLKGSLDVHTSPGNGTSVNITIPL